MDPTTISNVNTAIVNARDSTIAEDLISFNDLTNKAGGQATPTPASTKPPIKPQGGFDLTYVIIIIVAVVAALLAIMLKRGRKVEGYRYEYKPESRW